ncbi:MAG: FkbM family methyltransferase [Actinomycetota bacterium]|nr:FkbM family methyltransferase [Actinomycetota bacterium]
MRRIQRRPSLRRFKGGLWYGEMVRERRLFALREGLGGTGRGTYRLRTTGLRVVVRHGRYDPWALHEVIRAGEYTPPRPLVTMIGREPRRVVDLGANVGFFGIHTLATYPGASVVGFEPDPDNAASMRAAIRLNGLEDRWELIEAAASNEDGELRFYGGRGSNSRLAREGEVEVEGTVTVPAVDVFRWLDDVDLLKIDIEGGEWAILGDPRFARARPRAVVLEYHSLMCPQDNPRRAVRELLEGAGYVTHSPPADENPEDEPFWGVGVMWGWIEER